MAIFSLCSDYPRLVKVTLIALLWLSTGRVHADHTPKVRIFNQITKQPPIELRCQSGDDDLGLRSLPAGQVFNMFFDDGLIKRTLFFCHFYWINKDQVFDVYRTGDFAIHCMDDGIFEKLYYKAIHWEVREDGFYRRCGDPARTPSRSARRFQIWKKVYSW